MSFINIFSAYAGHDLIHLVRLARSSFLAAVVEEAGGPH
jgi:hypothetical protein